MVLSYIWVGFFIIAFAIALIEFFVYGNSNIFSTIVNSTFSNSKLGFEISIGLTGVLTLWMGLMNIGEKGGAVNIMSKAVSPFFRKLFPEVPKNHPAQGAMMMNFAANLLGLDNAATPLGLKAMEELQTLNPIKNTASNAQIMFLVLNTSGLTLIPISVLTYRAEYILSEGLSSSPASVFIPILLATFCSSLVGLIITAIFQKINLFDKVIVTYLGSAIVLLSSFVWYVTTLSSSQVEVLSSVLGNSILLLIIISFILLAVKKKMNVYELFIDGAKDGFKTAIKIIPYLVAILVAIGVFRASGAMGYLLRAISWVFEVIGVNTDFVPALPTALMKPLSGSGARGMMVDAFNTYGVDSFVGKLAATFQGTTDTTFFVLAVYFGSVGIKKYRYAVTAGLLADLAGIVAAVFIAYLFYR